MWCWVWGANVETMSYFRGAPPIPIGIESALVGVLFLITFLGSEPGRLAQDPSSHSMLYIKI